MSVANPVAVDGCAWDADRPANELSEAKSFAFDDCAWDADRPAKSLRTTT
jgi:hypothetical protein